MDPGFGLRVLLVEDNEDIREALTAILEGEGYEVVPVASAEAAVGRMLESPFNLVVTDYCLPVKTGTWAIEEARAKNALGSARVLMITAHPAPKFADGVKVMRKPLDVDDFLGEVERMTAPDRELALDRMRAAMATPAPSSGPTPRVDRAVKVELALYISSGSHSSIRALRNLRRLLARYQDADVRLTVHDLSRGLVPDVEEDRIAFTPTLVRRHPGPRTWVLGDLERPEVVADLLSLAGVEEKQ